MGTVSKTRGGVGVVNEMRDRVEPCVDKQVGLDEDVRYTSQRPTERRVVRFWVRFLPGQVRETV